MAIVVTVSGDEAFSLDLALRRTGGSTGSSPLAEAAIGHDGTPASLAADQDPGSSSASVAAAAAAAWRGWVSAVLSAHEARFLARFEAVWGLERRGFREVQVEAGRFAQSNLLGGLGYFAGRVEIKPVPGAEGGGGGPSFASALFSATPSRSFFPRGFAWDEGFHQVRVGLHGDWRHWRRGV